jgi:outer membrane lipoprotein-sorting protein
MAPPAHETSSARRRRLRWFAPLATAGAVAVVAALPGLSAAAAPSLPPITPQQLLVKAQQANITSLSGTVNLTTNLGIPDLGALGAAVSGGGQGPHDGQAFSVTDLLSGSHKALVWTAGPQQNRIDLLQDMAETDVIHNGANLWTWDSTTKKVTHYTLAKASRGADQHAKAPVTINPATDPATDPATGPAEPIKTPQQMADDLLAHLSPSTAISVSSPMRVAGRKAYQLVLTPHSSASTVAQVAIAVDSTTGLPLQVQIFAKGQKAAALKLGFGSISFSTPAALHFAFTPPPGSTVTNKTVNDKASSHATKPTQTGPTSGATTPTAPTKPDNTKGGPVTVGQDWTTVVVDHITIPAQLDQFLRAGTSVSGAFGQGTLLQTSLINVLVLNDGRVALGAVNASTLEAAVATTP